MELEEKVRAVELVFKKLDEQILSFKQSTALHCKAGCGKCCFKADIEATQLEFLPFAYYLYKNNLAYDCLDRLNNSNSSICHILNPTQEGAGLCSEYNYRGLICRLFGYSARTTKYNQKEYITCQIIKTEQSENYAEAVKQIEHGLNIPVMNEYYMQLHAIDIDLSRDFFPINKAIKAALEVVLAYYAYRED